MSVISDAWFHRLKGATRDLVQMCGGVERAGEKAGYGKSEVSRWQNPKDVTVIPIPAALALEAECGLPFITTVMADLNGRRLADREDSAAAGSDIFARHAKTARAMADVITQGAIAQEDGVITPTEAELLDRTYAELGRSVEDMRRELSGLKLKVVS